MAMAGDGSTTLNLCVITMPELAPFQGASIAVERGSQGWYRVETRSRVAPAGD